MQVYCAVEQRPERRVDKHQLDFRSRPDSFALGEIKNEQILRNSFLYSVYEMLSRVIYLMKDPKYG